MMDEEMKKSRSDGLIPNFMSTVRRSYRLIKPLLVQIHSKTDLGNAIGSPDDGILMYHGVGEPPNSGYFGNITTKKFERDIRYIRNNMEATKLASINVNKSNQQIAITFDDGLKSFYQNAYPILKKYNVPATIFINPGFIDDQDRNEIVSRHNLNIDPDERIILTDAEVEQLIDDPLITIGNHTLTHKKLSDIKNEEQLYTQIIESKKIFLEKYGVSIDTFCYPYGAVNSRSEKIVKKSHDISVITQSYLVNQEELHNLPRIAGHLSHDILRWKLCAMGDYFERYLKV